MKYTDTYRLDFLIVHWKHIHISCIDTKWIVYFHSSPISDPYDNPRESIDEAINYLIKRES